MPRRLTHLNSAGQAHMVDVGGKVVTAREAVAEGFVQMNAATLEAITENRIAKGEVLAAARIAGIMAAKKTSELIPLCHGLNVESVEVSFEIQNRGRLSDHARAAGELNTTPVRVRILAIARIRAKTGVEMEALTAVAIAALTIYDMCKAIDKAMIIDGIRLLKKTGGKSGAYHAPK